MTTENLIELLLCLSSLSIDDDYLSSLGGLLPTVKRRACFLDAPAHVLLGYI